MSDIIYKSAPLPDMSARSRRLALLALAVGSFAIGTAEFVSMGLLPEMAKTTGVDDPTASHYIAAYAMGVVIGAPILAVATAKMPRKNLLIGLMLFYALANITSAFAFSYASLVGLRFLSGLPHGIYFGVAALAGSGMVAVRDRPKAIGYIMLGLTIATVVGAPGATFIGQIFNWQVAFILVGIVAVFCAIMVAFYLPTSATAISSSPLLELGALKQKQVWLMLAVVSIGSGGLFAVFTYIKKILIEEAGYSLDMVPFIMPLIGCGMVVGNLVGPMISSRIGIMKTICFTTLTSALIYFLFYFLSHAKVSAAIGCFLVGTSFASMPSIQTRIMDVAAHAKTLAGALVQSAFNTGNALGAFGGGIMLSLGFSYDATGFLGAALTATGLVIFCYSWYLEKRDSAYKDTE